MTKKYKLIQILTFNNNSSALQPGSRCGKQLVRMTNKQISATLLLTYSRRRFKIKH